MRMDPANEIRCFAFICEYINFYSFKTIPGELIEYYYNL